MHQETLGAIHRRKLVDNHDFLKRALFSERRFLPPITGTTNHPKSTATQIVLATAYPAESTNKSVIFPRGNANTNIDLQHPAANGSTERAAAAANSPQLHGGSLFSGRN